MVTFGYLVPAAWQLSNQNLNPIVLDTGSVCGPTFYDSLGESICVRNEAFFLLDCATATYADSEGLGTVSTALLQPLQGIGELQSGTYSITAQDIVAG